jgi:hypothetical protein
MPFDPRARARSLRYWPTTLGIALGLCGCHVSARPAVHAEADLVVGPPVVLVDAPPVYVQRPTTVVYRGRKAYLSENGRWYYRTKRGSWAYFRQEPEELRRERTQRARRSRARGAHSHETAERREGRAREDWRRRRPYESR